MNKGSARQRLINVFLQELEERTSSMERDLLLLETADSLEDASDLVRNILRAAHSLKGAARLVEVPSIETACHWMEEILAAAQNGHFGLGLEQINLLLKSSDAIASLAPALSIGVEPPTRELDALANQLIAFATQASGPQTQRPEADFHLVDSKEAVAVKPPDLLSATPPPEAPEAGLDASTVANPMVSIPAARLDSLLIQNGELHLARAHADERVNELTRLHQLVWNANRRKGASRSPAATHQPSQESQNKPRLGSEAEATDDAPVFLPRLERELRQLLLALNSDRRAIHKAATALHTEIQSARLQEFAAACDGLDRFVRDLSLKSGKRAELRIQGGQVEIDRSIVQELRDIIRHLVRNAMDHGLETTEERKTLGKPEKGIVEISATFARDRIKVTVKDDGRGLDAQAISRTATELGITGEDEPEHARRLIFEPGLSTAETTTRISGRGVGLDAVRVRVEGMRGSISVDHENQGGTTFTILVPLTVGTIRAILVRAGTQLFALDTSAIRHVFFISPTSITETGGRRVVVHKDRSVPVLHLGKWLELEPTAEEARSERLLAVELNEVGKEVAIQVEEIVSEGEFLVRNLGSRLRDVRDFAGGIILPDGRIALVLNAASLGDAAYEADGRRNLSERKASQKRKHRLLIVDDSLTTRTLEKTILEAAGYEVSVAANGVEAWDLLSSQNADLIIADVDMPEMDGFALTEKIRQSAEFRDLPIILLTAREKEEDRKRGMDAGADAYLIKSAFDQRALLNTIGQML